MRRVNVHFCIRAGAEPALFTANSVSKTELTHFTKDCEFWEA